MAAKDDLTIPLEPNTFYHIFNRGNNGNLLFYEAENFIYFLNKYAEYMNNYWDTYAYCLPNNHFHLLIKVKNVQDILTQACVDFKQISMDAYRKIILDNSKEDGLSENDLRDFSNLVNLPQAIKKQLPKNLNTALLHQNLAIWAVSERFRRFLLSYAKAINRQQLRNGSLFQKKFRRKRVEDIEDCKVILIYIHRNGVHHGISLDYDDFFWSSYLSFLSDDPTLLERKEVLKWFGGRSGFIKLHDEHLAN